MSTYGWSLVCLLKAAVPVEWSCTVGLRPKSEHSFPAGLRPAEGLWPPERPSPSCRPSAYGRPSPCERLPGRPSASGSLGIWPPTIWYRSAVLVAFLSCDLRNQGRQIYVYIANDLNLFIVRVTAWFSTTSYDFLLY